MITSTWRFRALDTLFFRDSRPHGSVGAAILGSRFPPPPRTVAGAVRFLIGNALGADWEAFGRARLEDGYEVGGRDLLTFIGRHDDYGALRFSGPWLAAQTDRGWERLFPAPRTLTSDETGRPSGQLVIGPPVECDLGAVRLPIAPARGGRSVERLWLDAAAHSTALAGQVPTSGIYPQKALFEDEPRLGIGRDLGRHTAEEGMLYQTQHIRPHATGTVRGPGGSIGPKCSDIAVEVAVTSEEEAPAGLARLVRLGGEGRLADVTVDAGDTGIPGAPEPTAGATGLLLTLLTPVDLDGSWLPPGFAAHRRNGSSTTWRGELCGIALTIHSAAIGPTVREGGWDLAARRPRPVRSLVPAGSVWFATVDDSSGRPLTGVELAPAMRSLHGAQIINDPLGQGQLAVGYFDSTCCPDLEVPR